MSAADQSQPQQQTVSLNSLVTTLINSQVDCVDSLKLNLRLLNEKLVALQKECEELRAQNSALLTAKSDVTVADNV